MELAGIQIAIIVVTISIILSGIILGLGRALSYKRVERFGMEELFQSIFNAAIIGAAVAIVEAIKTISGTLIAPACSAGDSIAELACLLGQVSASSFALLQETLNAMTTIGYYQTMVLHFGSFSIQPLVNLNGISSILSGQVVTLNLLLILVNLNLQIVNFFAQNALALFFPLGLVLRSFFATRKIGGFLIGIAIGLYVFYPAFALSFPMPDLSNETAKIKAFNENPFYATVPILDLNGNNAIASKLDNMSTKSNVTAGNSTFIADLSGDLTVISQSNSNAISRIMLYAIVAPLFSLIITIIFIIEIANVLGGEMQFKTEVI